METPAVHRHTVAGPWCMGRIGVGPITRLAQLQLPIAGLCIRATYLVAFHVATLADEAAIVSNGTFRNPGKTLTNQWSHAGRGFGTCASVVQ